MKFKLIFIIVFTIITSCKGQEKEANKASKERIDTALKIIAEVQGDLDKDGNLEKVVVYDTDSVVDFGLVRTLHIYKKELDTWKIWRKSTTAILKSNEGGTMGDPFQGINIKKGILSIEHYGGSSWRWSYTHKYRFQNNDFFLIGVTTESSSGEDKTIFDYNLATGKAIYTFYTDGVLNKKDDFIHKMKELPKLTNMSFGENKIIIPKSKTTIYF